MDIAALAKTAEPRVQLSTDSAGDIADKLCEWELAAPGKRIARIVRGRKCATLADFYNEFAAALQFPGTFGENWDAFADCLQDGHRFPDKAAMAICITDADKLLSGAPPTAFETFAEVLSACLAEVNNPPKPGKPKPMSVVLQCNTTKATAVGKRWRATGMQLSEK